MELTAGAPCNCACTPIGYCAAPSAIDKLMALPGSGEVHVQKAIAGGGKRM